jgi:hypothetical protein
MESYRYLQFLYLIIPLTVGVEFFLTAQQERRTLSKESAVAILMDAGGYVFTALVPALFLFTIFSLSQHRLQLPEQLLHRMDRYGVMFFFLGSWWQIFLITGLRARRAASTGKPIFSCVWCPYLVLGLYVSALILWTAPFGLMWFSVFWFAASYGVLYLFDVPAVKVSKVFLILAALTFAGENFFFVILDAII